jgi:hypothetical protein
MRCAFTKRRLRDHLLGLFVAGGGKCKAAGQHSAGRSGGCFASARKLLSLCAFFTFYIYLRTVFVFFRFFFLLKQEAERGQLLSSSLCYLKAVKMGQWVTRLCASPLEDMSTWTCYFHVR